MRDDLVKRLRERARFDRRVQANNEVVATALMGQRLLFDQGLRSETNTFAVRLALNYANYAKNDAKLAADWEAAADRIEALTAERDGLLRCVTDNHVALCRAEKAEAERDRLRAALIEERTETLWNAYNTGMERDGRWRHMCMSDGEWLEFECGLDNSQPDHPADIVKAAIPLAAERFVAALVALKGETP